MTHSFRIHRQTRNPAQSRVRGTASLALLLALMVGLTAPARADETPSDAAQVLDRYIEVTGGDAAHAAIRNSVTKMTLTLPAQEISMTVTIYAARPNLVYTLVESPMTGKIESGVSGDVVWDLSTMTGPRLREGQEKADGLRDATFDSMSRWREVYARAELAGTDTVGGSLCDKVVLTPRTGKPRTMFFDRALGLLKRVDMTVETASGAVPTRTLMDDYREVGGILLAHRTEIEAMGQKRVMVVDSVAQNVDLPPGQFDPPADVKKLLEAKK